MLSRKHEEMLIYSIQFLDPINDDGSVTVLQKVPHHADSELEALQTASKKFENQTHIVALYAVWYNFVRIHKDASGQPGHGGRNLGSALEYGGSGGFGGSGGREAGKAWTV